MDPTNPWFWVLGIGICILFLVVLGILEYCRHQKDTDEEQAIIANMTEEQMEEMFLRSLESVGFDGSSDQCIA